MTGTKGEAAGASEEGGSGGWDAGTDTDVAAAIARCAAERCSGCLLVWREDAPDAGELFFARGRLVAAGFGRAKGQAALDALSRALPIGRARFFPGQPRRAIT